MGSASRRVSAASQIILKDDPPRQVVVDIYVLSIGDVDEADGTFSADFYVSFTWTGNWSFSGNNFSEPALPSGFEIMNGEISQKTQILAQSNMSGGYNYLQYRLTGTFFNTFNFSRYPLDTQTLTIEIEDSNYSVTDLIYVPSSQNSIEPGENISGWEINYDSAHVYVVDHYYNTTFAYPSSAGGSQTYSRATFSVTVHRPVKSAALELLLPVVVLTLLTMFSIRINPRSFQASITIVVTSIFTSVAFLLTFNSSIPPIGYFTLADEIMVVIFAVLIYALGIRIVARRYEPQALPKSFDRVYRASFFAIPVFVAVATFLLVF